MSIAEDEGTDLKKLNIEGGVCCRIERSRASSLSSRGELDRFRWCSWFWLEVSSALDLRPAEI